MNRRDTAGTAKPSVLMSLANFIRPIVLAAIWGGFFIFTCIGAPVLGPIMQIKLWMGLSAIFLMIMSIVLHKRLDAGMHWKHYLVIRLFIFALAFLPFCIAALAISASMLSILSATSPLCAALTQALWSRQRLTAKILAGLALGMAVVSLRVGLDEIQLQDEAVLAITCALVADFSYGIASIYAESAKKIVPFSSARGSIWAASPIILPATPFFYSPASPRMVVTLAVLIHGVICSGIAYLLYFRLIAGLGTTSALAVAFLIPVFGVSGDTRYLVIRSQGRPEQGPQRS